MAPLIAPTLGHRPLLAPESQRLHHHQAENPAELVHGSSRFRENPCPGSAIRAIEGLIQGSTDGRPGNGWGTGCRLSSGSDQVNCPLRARIVGSGCQYQSVRAQRMAQVADHLGPQERLGDQLSGMAVARDRPGRMRVGPGNVHVLRPQRLGTAQAVGRVDHDHAPGIGLVQPCVGRSSRERRACRIGGRIAWTVHPNRAAASRAAKPAICAPKLCPDRSTPHRASQIDSPMWPSFAPCPASSSRTWTAIRRQAFASCTATTATPPFVGSPQSPVEFTTGGFTFVDKDGVSRLQSP